MEQLVKLYRESHLGKRLPAYDGRKSLYTAGPLPFVNKEFKIVLTDEDDGSGGPRYILDVPLYNFSFLSVQASLVLTIYIDRHTEGKGNSKL